MISRAVPLATLKGSFGRLLIATNTETISRGLITVVNGSSFCSYGINSNRKYYSTNGLASGIVGDITPLDRLLRMRPSVVEEDREDELEDLERQLGTLDESKNSDPRLRIGKRLLSLGKVQYRHIEKQPYWFIDKQQQITSYRTSAQIRRTLKKWMIEVDRDEHAKYRSKRLGWGNLLKSPEKQKQLYAYGPDETAAYAYYHMPSRYQINKRVFTEISRLHPGFTPRRIVDFGCGPGTAAAAAYSVWPEGVQSYTGIDISSSMLDAAKIMVSEYEERKVVPPQMKNRNGDRQFTKKNSENSPNNDYGQENFDLTGRKIKMIPDAVFYDRTSSLVKRVETRGDRFDLAVIGNTLSELPNDLARKAAVQLMFELLDAGGMLVIVDEGNPVGSHAVRTARQFLLDAFTIRDTVNDRTKMEKDKHSDADANSKLDNKIDTQIDWILSPPDGFSYCENKTLRRTNQGKDKNHLEELTAFVVSPCSHDKACPLRPGTWCSFSQRVHSSMIRKSSEEKFSYVVIQKKPVNPTAAAVLRSDGNKNERLYDRNNVMTWKNNNPDTVAIDKFGAWSLQASDDKRKNLDPTPINVLTKFLDLEEEEEDDDDDVISGWDDLDDEEIPYNANHIRNRLNKKRTTTTSKKDRNGRNNVDFEAKTESDKRTVSKVLEELAKEVDWEYYNPPLYRQEWGRVIRSPIKSKGHATFDLCMPTGVIRRSVLSKSSLVAVPSLYTALRKTSWGGLFPVYGDDKEGSPLSGKKTKNIIGRVVQGPGSVSVLDEEYSDYDEDDEKWDEDTDERPYRGFRKKSFEEKPIKTTKKMITKANRSERGGRSDNHNSQLVRKSETREMADESNNHDELEGRPVGSIRRLRSQLRAKQLSAIRKRRTQSTDDKDSSDS